MRDRSGSSRKRKKGGGEAKRRDGRGGGGGGGEEKRGGEGRVGERGGFRISKSWERRVVRKALQG